MKGQSIYSEKNNNEISKCPADFYPICNKEHILVPVTGKDFAILVNH